MTATPVIAKTNTICSACALGDHDKHQALCDCQGDCLTRARSVLRTLTIGIGYS